jgi:hypothetical protein
MINIIPSSNCSRNDNVSGLPPPELPLSETDGATVKITVPAKDLKFTGQTEQEVCASIMRQALPFANSYPLVVAQAGKVPNSFVNDRGETIRLNESYSFPTNLDDILNPPHKQPNQVRDFIPKEARLEDVNGRKIWYVSEGNGYWVSINTLYPKGIPVS